MINLSYVAAYDPYHSKFRLLALLNPAQPATSIEAGRIADFYLCFPDRLSAYRPDGRVKGQVKELNTLRRAYTAGAYDSKADSIMLFGRMRPAQLAAMNSMASQGFLDSDKLRNGVLSRLPAHIENPLAARVEQYSERHSSLLRFLRLMLQVPLFGPNGLKARSGLEEFRYDNV